MFKLLQLAVIILIIMPTQYTIKEIIHNTTSFLISRPVSPLCWVLQLFGFHYRLGISILCRPPPLWDHQILQWNFTVIFIFLKTGAGLELSNLDSIWNSSTIEGTAKIWVIKVLNTDHLFEMIKICPSKLAGLHLTDPSNVISRERDRERWSTY